VAKLNLRLWQVDFVGAYLNSLTKEGIYMKQPEEFVQPGFEDYVCKLVHTIYGTMQGTHNWYETLMATYDKLNYIMSRADPCVRYKRDDGVTDTYIDDIFGALMTDEEVMLRWGTDGKSKTSKRTSIFSECVFNRTWRMAQSGSPSGHIDTFSIALTLPMYLPGTFLPWTVICP